MLTQQSIDIKEKASEINEEVIRWRRHLHENPELSFQETETSQFIYDTLQSFGNLEITRPTKTSVMARMIGGKPGKVIALRADMDALPIEEEVDLAFASKNKGVMHACGHDGHTAMLLGAAKIISEIDKDSLEGEIRFFFQHAEELQPGGAQEMVEAGVMEGVDAVSSIHLSSQGPSGFFSFSLGPATAANDTFDITIKGKGGHSSMPHVTNDPIATAAQLIGGINHFVSRRIDAADSSVISITKMEGGTAHNIIPETAKIGGSVRTVNPEVREQIEQWITDYTKAIAEANNCSYEIDYDNGYKAIINHKEMTTLAEKTLAETFGENQYAVMEGHAMASEDFSAFAELAPGIMTWLGAGSPNPDEIFPHHHPRFMINEDALELGVIYHVQMALNYLGK